MFRPKKVFWPVIPCLPSVRVLLALAFGLAATAPSALAVQRQTALSATVANQYSFQYLRYLPAGYDAGASATWPLMIFLHGAGERGTDVERVAVNGPPKLIEQGRDYPCIVVSPLCSGTGWVAAELQAFIEDIVKQYRIDPNRIYLTGLSMGGYGTWDLAVRYPDYYAAIAPLCGGGDPAQAYKLRDMPVWAFHGALDATVPVIRTQEMIDAIRKAGGDPLVTIYPALGHDVWTTTYANEGLYTWLFAQNLVRSPAPPLIGTQPKGQTVQTGGSTVFTVSAGGIPAPAIQWQRLPVGSTGWENLSEGGGYSGVHASALTIDHTAAGMAGDQFRAVLSNTSGSMTTEAVALTLLGSSLLQYPAGITLGSSGNFYVVDSASNTLRKITATGAVSTLAGTAGTAGSADGSGAVARFNQPGAIAADHDGNLYVADTGNATVRKVTPEGIVTTLAGSASSRGSVDGTGSNATFNAPGGIAADSAGNLYVADTFNATIRLINPAGVTSTYAGSAGNHGDKDGLRAAARFNAPGGMAVDPLGNIYVADTSSNTIRRIAPDGAVTTLAGTPGVSGATDGTGLEALFNQPGGLAVDSAGSIYVADTGNSTVRKITMAGAVTTLAGLRGIAGLSDGVGSSAYFNQPRGLAVDGAGNVFVADTGNAAIRKIAPGANVTTLVLAEVVAPATPGGAPAPLTGSTSTGTSGSASGGGGGGAVSGWFLGVLAALAVVRFGRGQARAC